MSDPAVTVIGNVNVDLLVRPSTALPPPGEEWLVETVDMRAGGAAANTALALSALGVPVRVVGSVGDDLFGRYLIDELTRDGIERDIGVEPATRTGVSIAFEGPGSDRSFLISLGSLATFDRGRIPEDALSARFVLLCGYFTMPLLRGTPAASILRSAKVAGATTLLDTGWDPGGWPAASREEIRGLLPHVDVLLPNAAELAALEGATDVLVGVRSVQRSFGGQVVVKLGHDGCLTVGPDGVAHRVGAPDVVVLDTTGAGDAFNAGLIAELVDGGTVGEAVAFATRLASTVVSRPSEDRYPSLDEVLTE